MTDGLREALGRTLERGLPTMRYVSGDYLVQALPKAELLGLLRRHGPDAPTDAVLGEVLRERQGQDAKWGEQNHPDGTGDGDGYRQRQVLAAQSICQFNAENGTVTWLDILREEVAETFAETDPAKLRAELVQVAAVAAAWVEAIDRRTAVQG